MLDLDAYRLERAGVALSLEPKAFNLLVLMIRRPGHLFSKQEIFEAVWPETAVTDHALTRVVAQLRRVLGDEVREARYLQTVPTRGYRWIRPIEEIPLEPALAETPELPVAARRVFPALASALVLATTVLAFLVWTQRGTPATDRVTNGGRVAASDKGVGDTPWPVQLTTYGGLDLQPALSPDGDAVAFVSDRTGAFEIYVRALGGTGSELPLTNDGAQNVQPAWSPDGRFLAFHSNRKGGIWVIPARGGTPRQIAAAGSNPAWSPDSLRVAFQSDEYADVSPSGFGAQTGSTIWDVGVDGRDLRGLTRTGDPMGGHAAPAWSPDGRHLAFSVFEAGSDNGIWILTLHTRETTMLERGHGLFESVFAPDNSTLYAAGGEPMIVRIPFDAATGASGGAREVIPVAGVPGVRGLTIARDGRRLGFAGLALSSQIWAQPVARDGQPAGPSFALTSDTSRRNSLPAVSPDGSKVAYMSMRRGELPNVWVMDIDGRNGLQLTSDETAEHKPTWFPDGRRVAYPSTRGTTRGIWSADIGTRREELLFDTSQAQRLPKIAAPLKGRLAELDLAPSMMQAAFTLIAPPAGHRILYVTGIRPFAPRALTDDTQSVGYPAWSRDGRYLAVEVKDGSSTHAAVVDVRTGVMRRLTSDRGQTWVRSWSPDGRKVAAAVLRDGVWGLRWIDVESGRQGAISPPGPPGVFVRYPEWSPRGNLVLFERGEMRGNIWMARLK